MQFLKVIILGIIQGITEFFPVSSSGHLLLFEQLSSLPKIDNFLFFSLVCHFGTIGSIIVIYYSELKELIQTRYKLGNIIVATLPLFPLAYFSQKFKFFFDNPSYLSTSFIFTASLIFASSLVSSLRTSTSSQLSWQKSLLVGSFQALAVMPGISRSGSTISAAKMLKIDSDEATRFSFMLAIPAILGALVLETFKVYQQQLLPQNFEDFTIYLAGACTSFVVGCISLSIVKKSVGTIYWNFFGCYCLMVGLFTYWYFN